MAARESDEKTKQQQPREKKKKLEKINVLRHVCVCVCVRAAIFIHGPCVCGISLGATGERTGAIDVRE